MEYKLFENTQLNPNAKFVEKITKRIIMNDGFCPCNQGETPIEDTKCPCVKYITTQECCCTLYIKK